MQFYNTVGNKKPIYMLNIFLLLSFLTFMSFNAFSQDLDPSSLKKVIIPENAIKLEISSINIIGNTQTSDEIITEQILLKEKNKFNLNDFNESIKNLKNLQVFSKIELKLYKLKNEPNKVNIEIELKEKLTFLPYFLAGSGGGSSYLVVGLYDTNFIGRLYTFNFTYGCKNDNCSTFIFFRNPSILGGPVNLVINAARQHDVFSIYNTNRDTVGSFSNKRDMLTSYVDVKLTNSLFIGGGFIYYNNNITNDGLSESQNITNNKLNYQYPDSTSSLALEGRLTLGSINYDGMAIDGVNFVSILDSTAEMYSNTEDNYTALNNTMLLYHPNIPFGLFSIPLPRLSYLAIRANLSMTTSNTLSQQYFLGGLDKIRGFFDNEFSGKFSWFTNFELRIPSYIGEYLALQHAIFGDAGFATDVIENIASSRTATSVGVGIRILPLKINRVALRFDYAYTLTPFHTFGFSFGLLQFF